jgi:hypothetical protein
MIPALRAMSLADLTIDDERSVAHVEVYRRLKLALGRSGHRFLIPAADGEISWDRVVFLNLTYWGGQPENGEEGHDAGAGAGGGGGDGDAGADVLCDRHIAADEVGHVAWHHVVARELARQGAGSDGAPSAGALFFSEAIASAFDLYLVGRLLHDMPDSDFITTQVPLIAERAETAGLAPSAVARLLDEICREPERAFEDMRALLLDVANALMACRGAVAAQRALGRFADHRFEPLLHHFEISNWILYARAYGAASLAQEAIVARLDGLLRQAPSALNWLADNWIDGDLAGNF